LDGIANGVTRWRGLNPRRAWRVIEDHPVIVFTSRNHANRGGQMKSITMNSLLQSIAILGAATATAVAAEPSPACAPILAAMAKTLEADHATLTQINGHTTNGITAGGVSYLQIGNVWKTSLLTVRENQARSDENLRNAKSYVCQSLPDGSIDGVAVANYRTRTETDEAIVESKISISKISGLAIEVDNDISAGGGIKSHYSTHYTYTAIHAPTLQK
jgi:hypothetical protein